MEIAVKKLKNGHFALEIDAVMLELEREVASALYQVIEQHLNNPKGEEEVTQKRLKVFQALANKMADANDLVLQKFLPKLTPLQLVTLVRLADGDRLYQKVLKNLSKTNRRQFEEDYGRLNKITVHQAIVNMEQVIPLIKEAIAEQKRLETEG